MEEAKTVRYVSKDPIQNLKVRVTLWRLSVHKSRANVIDPNASSQVQAQGQAQGQAQAPQPQPQALPQEPGVQQPFPQPLPQPLPMPSGQPAQSGTVPAGVAPAGAIPSNPQGTPVPAAGAFPAAPGQQMPGPSLMQQQPQRMQMQAQSVQTVQQQQPQMPPQGQPGPVAGQAIAEAFDMARPAPGQQSRSRMGPSNANRGGRQRMSVQERLDAAAGTLAAPLMPYTASGGARGWEPSAAATGPVTADPFVFTPAWDAGGGDISSNAGQYPPPAYPPPRRRGRPLGEAIEDPSSAHNVTAQQQPAEQQPQPQTQEGAAPAANPQQAQGQVQGQQQPQPGAATIIIPPQPEIPPVPYGSLGPEARMVAMGELPEVSPTTLPNLFPEKFKTSRVFGWQEKVYSRSEVAASQAAAQQANQEAAAAAQAAAGGPVSEAMAAPGQGQPPAATTAGTAATPGAVGPPAAPGGPTAGPGPGPAADPAAITAAGTGAATAAGQPGLPPALPQVQPGAAPLFVQQQQQQPQLQQPQAAVRNKRLNAFGSQTHMNNKQLDPRVSGSVLFTYVQSDDFCIQQELGRTVTTSAFEGENYLVSKLLSNSKGRQQVLTFRSMYIMADLGDESDVGSANEKVLVSVRAYPDGSFDMCPGFSKPGVKYRFEDIHGGIFEFTVENASATDIPSLEKRTVKLERAVVARAEELRRAALKADFEPPPADECTRLLLLAEIQSAADFPRDRLYIEYVIRWDPQLWELTSQWPESEPGIVQGVTHISRVTTYPSDPATDTPARDVAHFAHPVELEWVSRTGGPPQPQMYPAMFFQVCTLDKLNRYTCEGYGWLSLNGHVPGCGTHVLRTWKPLGTIRDRQAAFFIGGSAELADLAYLATPTGFNGKILNKYGFKTETIGAIKVRLNTVVQQFNPDAAALAALRRSSGGLSLHRASHSALVKRNSKKDMSLKMVVERARQRLREARGTDELPGGDVAVRPGVLSEAPTIVVNPQDAVVAEESTVRLKVVARGLPPLKYEWYKDDRRLMTATADKPELILVQVGLESEGSYYCQVSNKDGSVNSSKATLTVTRAARVTRASAAEGGEGRNVPRRPPRTSATSPGGSQSGRISGTRLSRLARLDAAAPTPTATPSVVGSEAGAISPTEGGPPSQTSGGSGGGAGASPRISATDAIGVTAPGAPQHPPQPSAGEVAAAAPGADPIDLASLPPLPPPAMPPPRPPPAAAPTSGPDAVEEVGGGVGGSGGGVGGILPPSVAAAATSGFQRRPPRAPAAASSGAGGSGGGGSASGSGGGGATTPPAAVQPDTEVVEEVEEVEDVREVQAQPKPQARRRMRPADDDPPPAPAPQPPASRPQRPTARRDDDDDLEAEEIE